MICDALIARGPPADTPAAVVHAASTPRQRIFGQPLAALPAAVRAAGRGSPSLNAIGSVTRVHAVLQPAVPQRAAAAVPA